MNAFAKSAEQNVSNKDILDLNTALEDILTDYVAEGTEIRFDIPDPDKLGTKPTVSVFLYDVHEDLTLNTSQSNRYDNKKGRFAPDHVNLCCNYIITYWENVDGEMSMGPKNQAITIMNQIINALINNRTLTQFPNAKTRVMPPREELNSLGNFWQALGSKPRMVLNYSVTLPISLAEPTDIVTRVENTTLEEITQDMTQSPLFNE
ncbi:DUF4255 domain-containing protein [Vibrio sp. AND4]|uniref:DUF4255 domain-containing protein n=1 Tax=Vibrio sp. AND4 TaxID=314289 RepID=UPI00015F2C3C|nr:DUF4255 domain-containing protein [Vibrio sp. AND4]EDP57966.1 hypothetical protein AND4_05329 [Vibrio sp. AND4]